MGKKAKGKHRLDKFYYLAKEQGFRSRASFKLVQLNRKYDFFSGARACMDLCAAPGGWLQVAQKYMPMSSLIVGVDLAPIKPIRGCTTFVDDITTQSCRAQLRRVTPDGTKYDIVMNDGAPNVGGNFAAESYTQAALTLDSLRLASEFLREGGWFVTKVFRSTEYHALLYSMQQLFKKVESTKPVASRGTSAEIYVVCIGYLAPAKIDPRLLDPRALFADYDGPKQAIDVLARTKQKRNRSGYEDGAEVLYKECPAETFVHSDKPAELLGQYHAFILDASGKKGVVPPKDGFMDLDAHPATTPEIRSLCEDLGVLGKVDFKLLLKWRLAVRKTAGLDGKLKAKLRGGVVAPGPGDEEEDEEDAEAGDGDGDDAKDEDDKLLEEMESLKQSMDARARRDKKKKAKVKAKERQRAALGLHGQDEEGATGASEMDLFSLTKIRSKTGLDSVAKAEAPGVDAAVDSDDELQAAAAREDEFEYDPALDGDGADNQARLESELDMLYEEYKSRHKRRGAKFDAEQKKGRADGIGAQRTALGAGELDDDDASDLSDGEDAAVKRARDRAVAKEAKDAALSANPNPLLVDLGAKDAAKAAAKAGVGDWFDNDLFAQPGVATGSAKQAKAQAKAAAKRKAAAAAEEEDGDDSDHDDSDASGFDDDDEYFAADESSDSESDQSDEPAKRSKRSKKTPAVAVANDEAGANRGKKKRQGNGKSADASDSDEDDYDELRRAADDEREKADAKAAKRKEKEEAIKKAKAAAKRRGAKYDDTYDDDEDSSEDDGGWGLEGDDATGTKMSRARAGKDNAGFMEVAAEMSGSESSDDGKDVDDISDGEKAEILAIGKKMLRKKERDRIIDDAYNKYARDDDEDLPEWFLEDERKFMRPAPVYDQADLDEAAQKLAAVDTKSIKKVAEAKWRKKKRAEKKMQQARQRASTIMEQEDVPDVSKAREIEKIYAKARTAARGKRREIKHVVARKVHKGNAGGPSVDKRMLADRRGQLKAKGGVKKGGRGGRGGRGGGARKGGGGGRGKKGFK